MLILDLAPRQACTQKNISTGQYQRTKTTAFRAVSGRLKGSKNQKIKLESELERF